MRSFVIVLVLVAATQLSTPVAAAPGQFQDPVKTIKLRPVGGSKAAGTAAIFANKAGRRDAYTLFSENVPRIKQPQAIAVWLTGGPRAYVLAVVEPFDTTTQKYDFYGPLKGQEKEFKGWIERSDRIVLSVEPDPTVAAKPGKVILRGRL